MNENELCTVNYKVSRIPYLIGMAVSFGLALLGILVNLIVASIFNEFGYMGGGGYWAGWSFLMLGTIVGVIFLVLFLTCASGQIVLTNKRIKMVYTKKRIFSTLRSEESIVLDKIISFRMLKQENKSVCRLSFSTVKNIYNFVTPSQEFYDKFVEQLRQYN